MLFRISRTATIALFGTFFAFILITSSPLYAQSTVATGSIEGTLTDPSGAVVQGAKVTITNQDTGQSVRTSTSSAGTYNSGTLVPGNYSVRAEAAGFKTVEEGVVVRVGVVSGINLSLPVGASNTVVEVAEQSVAVNTEQPSVQGVLNREQIENLPVNGRNFLDLAQLEPGVQIQDGADFDPTKVGFSSISMGGRFGRTARIEVDGVDVSDETVGTTTENIPASAIDEFQISQSTLDLSNELTSSGAVNVTTRAGTNNYHGEGFALFRDSAFAAALPGPPSPYARNQDGGNLGGAILKDKLFFFLDAEHTNQNLVAPVIPAAPFDVYTGNANSPFRETDYDTRLDWQFWKNVRMFYRFSYFDSKAIATGGGVGYQPFQDKNYTKTHVIGADFTTKGGFTHSFRFEYLKLVNNLGDTVLGSNLPFANLPVSLNFISFSFFTGPNLLAPQQTFQTNRQLKYDGSKLLGTHILRYGVSYNRLRGGGFAAFNAITPDIFPIGSSTEVASAATGPFTCPGGITGSGCPLNYPVDSAFIGNGLGCGTEIPAFNEQCGGTPPDNRLGLYVGDSWKVKSNLTVTYGVRYVRDTGRTDSDLPGFTGVTATYLDSLMPGLANPVRQPNHNFGPQLGIAWDPRKDSKTVIRAGIGVFYENAIWNNVEFDRPERLATGAFLATPEPCSNGVGSIVPLPNGTSEYLGGVDSTTASNICSSLIGATLGAGTGNCTGMTTTQCLAAFQTTYQQASAAVGTRASNPSYLPNLISSGSEIPIGALAPNYRTPYSVQMNAGIQRELMPGMVLSIDYLRNVNTHYLIGIDANHSGDVNPKYFNLSAAQQAIATTNSQFGCPMSFSPPATSCALHSPVVDQFTGLPGASIASYANNGLDSAADLGVGSCSIALGVACAFQGANPNLGPAIFLYPIGRSVYNAMDVKLVDNVKRPFRGVSYLNIQFAYALSRFTNCGGSLATSTSPSIGDQDFITPAIDNNNPCGFSGPSALDRTHQFSFGGYADLPAHFRLGTIFHFDSPLASGLAVPETGIGPGEIFRTDFTGDGTFGDPVPGTKQGSFMRGVSVSDLPNVINNYNNNVADNLTPAGQLLVSQGLFTAAQLGAGNQLCVNNPNGVSAGAACAVAPSLAPAVPGEVGLTWLKTFDASLTWIGKVNLREREFTLQPGVSFYNLFNFANFNIPGNVLSGILTGTPGSVNGTTYANANSVRVGVGTGVFALGAPRTIEFGMKLTF
jgi:hypothetical protein